MKSLPPETATIDNENELEKQPEPPRKKRRWLWLLLALLLFSGGGVLAWQMMMQGEEKATEQNAQPQKLPVKLASVESGIIEDRDEYIARLESRRSVTLQPQIQGRITKI
mgnify:FL=1